MSSGEKVM